MKTRRDSGRQIAAVNETERNTRKLKLVCSSSLQQLPTSVCNACGGDTKLERYKSRRRRRCVNRECRQWRGATPPLQTPFQPKVGSASHRRPRQRLVRATLETVTCNLCHRRLTKGSTTIYQQQHIWVYHMKEVKRYSCPVCPTTSNFLTTITSHIGQNHKHHRGTRDVVSNYRRVRRQFDNIQRRCFSDNRGSSKTTDTTKRLRTTATQTSSVICLSAKGVQVNMDGEKRDDSFVDVVDEGDRLASAIFYDIEDRIGSVARQSEVSTGYDSSVPVVVCNLCTESIPTGGAKPRQHAWKHLGYKQYFCPHCIYLAEAKPQVIAHIRKHHADKDANILVDNYDNFQEAHDAFYELCFGDDGVERNVKRSECKVEYPTECAQCSTIVEDDKEALAHVWVHIASPIISCSHCEFEQCHALDVVALHRHYVKEHPHETEIYVDRRPKLQAEVCRMRRQLFQPLTTREMVNVLLRVRERKAAEGKSAGGTRRRNILENVVGKQTIITQHNSAPLPRRRSQTLPSKLRRGGGRQKKTSVLSKLAYPISCAQCVGETICDAAEAERHLIRHLNFAVYACPYCPKRYPADADKLDAYEHVHVAHADKELKVIRSELDLNSDECEKTMRNCFGSYLITGVRFVQAAQKGESKRDEDPDGPPQLDVMSSSEETSNLDDDKAGAVSSTSPPPLPTGIRCQLCRELLSSEDMIIGHVWIHIGITRLDCPYCSHVHMRSTLNNYLKQHIWPKHPRERCEPTDFMTNVSAQFPVVMRACFETTPAETTASAQLPSTAATAVIDQANLMEVQVPRNLSVEQVVAADRFDCGDCGKSFVDIGQLVNHMETH